MQPDIDDWTPNIHAQPLRRIHLWLHQMKTVEAGASRMGARDVQMIPDSPKRNGSIVFPTGIDSMWQQRQPIWSPEPDLFESVAGNLAPLIWFIT